MKMMPLLEFLISASAKLTLTSAGTHTTYMLWSGVCTLIVNFPASETLKNKFISMNMCVPYLFMYTHTCVDKCGDQRCKLSNSLYSSHQFWRSPLNLFGQTSQSASSRDHLFPHSQHWDYRCMTPCPDYMNFTFLNLVHTLVRKVSLPLNYLLSIITLFTNYVYIFVSIIVLKKIN